MANIRFVTPFCSLMRCLLLFANGQHPILFCYRHILHDEANFTDPFKFDPERWIKNGKLDQELIENFGDIPFGFGRRSVV